MGSLHVLEHGLFVVQPLASDLLGGEVLAAGQLEGDLECVGVDVVEVLHAAGHVVPLGAVRDSAGEVIAAKISLKMTITRSSSLRTLRCF